MCRAGTAVPFLKHYWAIVISPEGNVFSRLDLFCETEDEAKERVRQLVADKPVELWDGPRRVARFHPKL
jgi:hypothetical protein